MTTIEKIKAEIQKALDAEGDSENARAQALALFWVLELFDKYAEQEPCDDCDYSEIMDWEQDAKTGKAKPIYWCERHKEPCDDAISRQAVIEAVDFYDGLNQQHFTVENLREDIEKLPSVRPQEQTGHWLYSGENGVDRWTCDNCFDFVKKPTKVCPNCGAKMVEPQESEDKG